MQPASHSVGVALALQDAQTSGHFREGISTCIYTVHIRRARERERVGHLSSRHSQSCRSSGPETSEIALAMAATSWKCQVK